MRINAASTWSASSPIPTHITVNGSAILSTSSHDDSVTEGVTPFLVHRVSAAHSYRSLTPLNMDMSDSSHHVGHNNNNNNSRLLSHGESTDEEEENGPKVEKVAKNCQNLDETYPNTSNETSLEMIKILNFNTFL